ncbi:MAG TPA: hypothetical protein VEX88_04025 [Glaciibacter sp.]|nr:hypothetical protein [Glaciibacter sp.]
MGGRLTLPPSIMKGSMMTSNYPSDVPPTNLSGVGVPATDDLTTDDYTTKRTGDWQDGAHTDSGKSGMKEDVKEQASNLKEGAADAGQHVADVAKQETKRVASEAGSQARGLMYTVRDEIRNQASTQQYRVAEGIRGVSSQLSGLAQGQPATGVVGDLVNQARQRTDSIASWLEQREPADILDEVKRFARQRPGVFIALSVGAGILAGRLTKALTSAVKDERTGGQPGDTYRRPAQSPERVGMVSPDVVTPGVGTAGLVDDPTVDGSGYSDSRAGGGPLGGGLS